jgi:diguanylate cyclase (GGDEF)-like protein
LFHPVKIVKVLLLALLAGGFHTAFARNEAVNWRVWNTGDGMIEAFISQVTRAPSGQIVVRHGDVATFDVIDGIHLTSLPDRISLGRIIPDDSGTFYSFDKAGILVLEHGQWKREPFAELPRFQGFGTSNSFGWFGYPNSLDVLPRVSAALAGRGKMLFTFSGKLIEWSRRAGTHLLRESLDSAIGDFIDIVPAGAGTFFISGTKGLAHFRPDTGSWTAIPGAAGFSRFVFPSFLRDGGLLVTAGRADGRKQLLLYSSGEWKVIYTGEAGLHGWEADGHIWVLDGGKLFSLVNGKASEVKLHPLVSGRFMDAAVDGDAFWLATEQGLARYAPPLWELPEGAPDLDGVVNAITEGASGDLWFASGHLLIRHSGKNWRTYHLPPGETQGSGKTETVCPMDNGRILVLPENTSHLLELEPSNGRFRVMSHPEGRIIKGAQRRDGAAVLVQTLAPGERTSRIEVFDGKAFTVVPGTETLFSTDVKTMLQTKAGVIWIGSTNSLVRLANGRLETFHKGDGLTEENGYSLIEAKDGTVYIGQRDSITAFDGRRFHVLRSGMDRVRRLALSGDGSLWAASGTGIHRLRGGNWVTNGLEEGLPSNAGYTVFADSRERIWAGTTFGFGLYSPRSDTYPPVTSIQENQNLRKAPPGGEVRFAFSGVDPWKQTPPERLLFSWRLDGGEWSAFDKENLVAVRALRSGAHIFRVRAMDRNGNVDPHPAAFPFEVLYPWYREWGFYIVAGVLVVALGQVGQTGYTYHRNLRFQCRHDVLTGLPNRLQFEEALSSALEKSTNGTSGVAVLFMDLDGFKAVNDNLGHLAGDKLLVNIGARLTTLLRPGDVLARLGGDEFAILLSKVEDRESVARFAARTLEGVRSCSPSPEWRVAASIGISLAPEQGTLSHVLIRLADIAMYQSKAGNGDCHLFYEEAMKADSRSDEMAGRPRTAIKSNHFVLWFQPIVDREGRVIRMEALIRMNNSELGLISPGSFIAVGEETGLIHAIGNWVLRDAARTARLWRQSGCDIPIAVNISPVQLDRTELAGEVLDILAEFGLPASAIAIEITETAIARNQTRAAATLARLRSAGVYISLDDFGTGYSLNMLAGMPVDEIKLDRAFAASIASPPARDVLSQTIRLARNLNILVVAEGIEDTSQMATAIKLGCDGLQGLLIAPPLEPEVATRFILDQTDLDVREDLLRLALAVGIMDTVHSKT